MADDSESDPRFGDEEWMKEAFRKFLSGDETFNPEELMKAAGINVSPDELRAMMAQLGSSFAPGGALKPHASRDHAVSLPRRVPCLSIRQREKHSTRLPASQACG